MAVIDFMARLADRKIDNAVDKVLNGSTEDAPGVPSKPPRYCWTCGACGSALFNLMYGGFLECAECDTVSSTHGHFRLDQDSDLDLDLS